MGRSCLRSRRLRYPERASSCICLLIYVSVCIHDGANLSVHAFVKCLDGCCKPACVLYLSVDVRARIHVSMYTCINTRRLL